MKGMKMKQVIMMLLHRQALPIDHPPHLPEIVDTAGDRNRPFLLEAVLLLGLLEQPREQGVVEVHHRHHEPLPLLPHPHHHAPLRRHIRLLVFPRPSVVTAAAGEVEAEAVLVSGLHLELLTKTIQGNKRGFKGG